MNKRSSFSMSNRFNGYGDKTYIKAIETKTYMPLSQKDVRRTPDFSGLVPKMLGIKSVVIDPRNMNDIVMTSLGGEAIANKVIIEKNKLSEGYSTNVQIAGLGMSTGSYLENKSFGSDVSIINPGIQPGWEKQTNGEWKYINESGAYIKGDWKQYKGKWYYLNTDEYMLTNWNKISGKWYYFKPGQENGYMVLGWRKIEGKWYYFKPEDEAGYMVLGWRKIEDKWYYFEKESEAGYMVLGWKQIDGKLYYFDEEGEAGYMVLGWKEIDGKLYYFEEKDEAGYVTDGKEPINESDVDDWMSCVEEIGKWYVKNVNTYLNNDNQGQRKGYSCDILGKTVYDDCSSYVSSCLVYLGIITSTQYNSRAYNKDDPDYKPSLGYALEGAGFVWHKFDQSYIPRKGDISVQHNNCHHVEIIDGYDSVTGKVTIWSWGKVYKKLPATRTIENLQNRMSGYWRKES
ncbi:hypothetical protein ADH76_11605 [Enterocloster clostridioformis]|nr:hypothetical protein A4V08_23005 [Lachnoclostridium sp. YL32]NDO29509.1 N-acetylmuramoyl-L-alanine amidase family protein [Enterocloster clostridioformis]OXE69049.1 hypothetical protein ADH76_11605 [Enterocloster clostridioformis]QQR02871.1 N-acetylmuramoyl-L-alanine amidase family protein [Enterocloster clostridioformis]